MAQSPPNPALRAPSSPSIREQHERRMRDLTRSIFVTYSCRSRERRPLLSRLCTLQLCLRVGFQEMPEHHQQLARVVLVAAAQRVVNVVADHVAYPLGAVRLLQQILSYRSCGDLRDMLMLGNGHDLVLGEATHGDTVLRGY